MDCKKCNAKCIKRGFNKNTQRFYCTTCKKYFQSSYTNKLCNENDEKLIVILNNEGVGISSIARITGISKANVVRKIKLLAAEIIFQNSIEENQIYEADELQTYIQKKENKCYVSYAINKKTKQVINFTIGARTKENIGKVIKSLNALNPKKIFTDKLNIYPGLIKKEIHVASPHKINHIERYNLTLRTHLKRLSRKTICFSKNKNMLENCLRIYFSFQNSVMSR